MRTALFLFAATGCQALTDPCFEGDNYEGPGKCLGEIRADLTVDPPEFWVDDTTNLLPNEFSISIAEEDPCTGGSRLWEVRRLREQHYPIAYGVLPQEARDWKNELHLVDGELPPLVPGTTYEVSFFVGDRLDSSGMANSDWSGFFVAGEAGSLELYNDRCFPEG